MVGDEDLVARILDSGGGGLAFDKAIATPDMMPRLSKVRVVGLSCAQEQPPRLALRARRVALRARLLRAGAAAAAAGVASPHVTQRHPPCRARRLRASWGRAG